MMRVYVASSWRNEHQPIVVSCLRDAGYQVYDFIADCACVDTSGLFRNGWAVSLRA